jgi:diguanylate cyclase (GGDEF)-like protein
MRLPVGGLFVRPPGGARKNADLVRGRTKARTPEASYYVLRLSVPANRPRGASLRGPYPLRSSEYAMVDQLKVGIVYRDQTPHVFTDLAPEVVPWPLEFIEEGSIRASVPPRGDFLAVFCPVRHEPDLVFRLSTLFPGAAVLSYRQSPQAGALPPPSWQDAIPVVQFPISASLAEHLVETYAALKRSRGDLAVMRRRSDEIEEFLGAFINAIESSWSIGDRRLGMNMLLQRLAARLNAQECLIYLMDSADETLHRAWGTANIKDIDLFDFRANGSIVETVLRSGVPYVNNNYCFELKVPFSSDSVYIRSILCLPLQRRGEKIGVIEVLNSKAGSFSEEDQALLRTLASPVTVALRSIRTFEGAEQLTITDDLTKLYNYRFLMQFLESEVRRCLRYKKKVSLLFIDVDGFKRINDTFGHLVGSHALAEMGQVFRRILRDTDIVGRYGGDEFVIVLPETPLNGALVIAERIRKKVEDYEFTAQNLSIRLTVSLGVANCPKHTLTAEGLIKKADAAMYRAKELSKNSIKVAV